MPATSAANQLSAGQWRRHFADWIWRAFSVLATGCLLPWLCVVYLWAGSWRAHHVLTINRHTYTLICEEWHGGLYWQQQQGEDGYYNTASIILTSQESWDPIPAYAQLRRDYSLGCWYGGVPTGEPRERAGWIPLNLLAAVLIAPLLGWVSIRLLRRNRPMTDQRARKGLLNRLQRWVAIACAGASISVAFLWIESACWHEWFLYFGSGWALDSPRRECALELFKDRSSDQAVAVSWWPTLPVDRVAHPIALRLFPAFDYQPITDGTAGLWSTPSPPKVIGHSLVIPYWFLFVSAALFPAYEGINRLWNLEQRRARRRTNVCTVCGYDLRASTDRCPECGKPTDDAD